MDHINGENNNGMPVKRKRGRPRKDKSIKPPAEISSSLKNSEITPSLKNSEITPSLNYPPQSNPGEDTSGSLVGQPVRGVIEALFDGGFLLNVHIGNSGTCLRGVVFEPGHHHTVSARNDVAPHVQMVNRKDLPNGATGNGQVLKNGSFWELENSKVKDEEISAILPISDPSVGMVDKLPNGVSENKENLKSNQSEINGISRLNETNNRVEDSSQSLQDRLENCDDTNKPLDLEPLTDVHSVNNNNQSQEAPESYVKSTMGAMSMLLQVVQEKMTNPGGSS